MKLTAWLLAVLGTVGLVVLSSVLFAYPTMWIINKLFSQTFVVFVFGASKITLLQAWLLNMFLTWFGSKGSE